MQHSFLRSMACLALLAVSASANEQADEFVDELLAAYGSVAVQISPQSATNSSTCCDALVAAGIQNVLLPGTEPYNNRIRSYWSVQARLSPWCVAQPISPQELAVTVKTIVGQPSCNFAVRSGGHMIWPGSNGIEKGVTIDTGLMNQTTIDTSTLVASIGAGTNWGHVYAALEPYGVTVAGGRAAQVGVAGFLTGGGNSFYSARKGFATDTVVNFEVVLADGSIVNANATSHPDLWVALKGGQANFGIVTRFEMQAFPASNLWGGAVIYNVTAGDQLLSAYVDWTDSLGRDGNVNGSAITFWQHDPIFNTTVIVCSYVDTHGNVNAAEFGKFLAIEHNISTTMRLASHYELVTELNQPLNSRDIWWTGTIKNDRRVYDKFITLHDAFVVEMDALIPNGNYYTQAMLQAIPRVFSDIGKINGGNVLGLDRNDEPVVMLLFTTAVTTAELQKVAEAKVQKLGEDVMAYAASVGSDVEWQYINYAYGYQDPLTSYGPENKAKILAASQKYDPTGVFQTRAPGGFKIANTR